MESNHDYQKQTMANLPPLAENNTWKAINPQDQHRFDCEHFTRCGQNARWVTRQGNLYTCDYHRFLLEVLRTASFVEAEKVEMKDVFVSRNA
jgi:sulfatase maturation enzyme AslB (radical SAM superfamily)